jgi:AraC-like DNA-binding protein
MATIAAPLMERLRIFQSRDADETRTFLSEKNYRFDVSAKNSEELDVRINGVYMPYLYIGYVQYGNAAVALHPGRSRTDYWMQLPLRGNLSASIGRDSVACTPLRGVIASPAHEECRFLSQSGSSRIQVALNGSALERHLAALLGEQSAGNLDFAPAIDLDTGSGRSVARYVLMAVADLEQDASVLQNPFTMRAFEDFISTALLLAHPHNYTEALHRVQKPPAPRNVKRALDFMEANMDVPISIADIVAAAGVPGRTLFKHFKDWRGISPMQHLRNARFAKVRQVLLQAGSEGSVTDIAMRWGFAHMGRFAVEYRQRFGETPSDTLRRPRRNGRGL